MEWMVDVNVAGTETRRVWPDFYKPQAEGFHIREMWRPPPDLQQESNW